MMPQTDFQGTDALFCPSALGRAKGSGMKLEGAQPTDALTFVQNLSRAWRAKDVLNITAGKCLKWLHREDIFQISHKDLAAFLHSISSYLPHI